MELFDVYALYDLLPTHAKGQYVYTAEGQEILDFYGGHAVISIGHSHPHYVKMLQEQVAKLGFYSNSVQNPLQQELAQKLGALSGLDEYRLFLCNSGAEANENALKLASFHTGRSGIIAFKNAFHGRTSAAVNATDSEKIKAPINRQYPVTFVPLNDLAATEAALAKGDIAAVIVEGIQGIGGVYVPDAAFLEALAPLCKAQGALLILDEIQSGYGRSGRFFAFQHSRVEPDIVSVAKGMGNGFPIGGILIHPHLEAKMGMLGTTFGGNHLACAAGIAVLDVLEAEGLVEQAAKLGAVLIERLKASQLFREVRGKGLMIGLQMEVPTAPLRKELLFKHHIFTGSASDPTTIRLLPPLSIDESAIDRLLEALAAVCKPVVNLKE